MQCENAVQGDLPHHPIVLLDAAAQIHSFVLKLLTAIEGIGGWMDAAHVGGISVNEAVYSVRVLNFLKITFNWKI